MSGDTPYHEMRWNVKKEAESCGRGAPEEAGCVCMGYSKSIHRVQATTAPPREPLSRCHVASARVDRQAFGIYP
jgi:hypothetical protein